MRFQRYHLFQIRPVFNKNSCISNAIACSRMHPEFNTTNARICIAYSFEYPTIIEKANMFQLILTCEYPALLIGFHHQNRTNESPLSFAKLVPCDSSDAKEAWGTPEDAFNVRYRHSDDGYAVYCFETSKRPREWLMVARTRFPRLGMQLTCVD